MIHIQFYTSTNPDDNKTHNFFYYIQTMYYNVAKALFLSYV